ncbi:heparan-alpha-glucosaminide N-acetyltransferase [Aliihoeflea sp. 2WW]|uniref:heparan-alpha-glucosaminide N-acetyltransferase n=1 Tax=unclassified Aliihoeflea TaxID=2628764 RepID=UPI00046413BB|nr:heparan-alpha-glucosaminide N-acetyltransferase [Aliihoeflea sp. 2WW]
MDRRGRIDLVDSARGLAILGVVLFHVVWDLEYVGLISGIVRNEWWLLFGRFLAMSFMFLVGVSLVLAHRAGSRPGAFSKRVFVIMAAAAAITAVTYVVFPQTFIYFGILHAIAAASFIGRPFVTIRLRICAASIVLMFAAPFVFDMASFDTRWLAWTGLAANPPASNDFVPVLPSVAFTLLGIVAARLLRKHTLAEGRIRSVANWAFLIWMGRNSLAIYLLHQPILLGVIVSAATLAN